MGGSLLAGIAMATAITIHVAPNGNDHNSGRILEPLQTFDAARLAAREYMGRTVHVKFASGVYRLAKTVTFSANDSGDVTYMPEPGAKVILSGAKEFTAHWEPYQGQILECRVPEGFDTDQLFINGSRQTLARYPNENLAIPIFHGYAKDAISPERVARWKDPTGGFLHAMHAQMWGDFHYKILGKNPDGSLRMEGGWQNNRRMGMHDEYRFVEGIFEELDAPGEWFLNRQERTLYYYPKPGIDLANCLVEGPHLQTLVRFDGCHGIKLVGLGLTQTLRTFMDNREPLLRSDWTIYRGGAVTFNHASHCEINDCVLHELGGNGLFVDGENSNLSIRRCQINSVGANGVAFVGSPKAVRSPLFEYGQTQSYQTMDKLPGPRSADYPVDCLVEDCLIHDTGQVEKQTAAVQIAMSMNLTVRHCSIYHVPRAGINIGDGCWGGHVIEGCDVFDTVLETGDHGSFNSWGRDRYWNLTDVDMTLGKHPELAKLDSIRPTTLRNNRWRCDHGWDIDLDDGSSEYIIENNLCLNGGLKNREGFNRRVENNVIVGNSFHPHVWFQNSEDVFKGNIVCTPYRPIGVPAPWGQDVDFNLLQKSGMNVDRPASILAYQSGRDLHSREADALFVNPAVGDFRVGPNSAALKLGFKNFAMDSFGVRPPSLRALARTPTFAFHESAPSAKGMRLKWLNATLADLIDPGEISVVGGTAGRGVLIEDVWAQGILWAKVGLRPFDVILEIDGVEVKSIHDLVFQKPLSGSHRFTVWRDQRSLEIRAQLP